MSCFSHAMNKLEGETLQRDYELWYFRCIGSYWFSPYIIEQHGINRNLYILKE